MKDIQLQYKIYGNGSKTVFAFHGFGQHISVYKKLSRKYPNLKIYAFPLPFHFSYDIPDYDYQYYPDAEEWINPIKTLAKQDMFDEITIIAFSFGSRFAMRLMNAVPHKIQQVILLAPDGITNNIWFSFATQTKLGLNTLKFLTQKTHLLKKLLDSVYKWKWIGKDTYALINVQLKDNRFSRQLYHTWRAMSKFDPTPKSWAKTANQFQIPVSIYLGKKDTLIQANSVIPFTKKLHQVNVHEIKGKHNKVLQKWIKQIDIEEWLNTEKIRYKLS